MQGPAAVGMAATAETLSTSGTLRKKQMQSEKQQQQHRQQHNIELEQRGTPTTAGTPESVELETLKGTQ
jgi:hypothetical protein